MRKIKRIFVAVSIIIFTSGLGNGHGTLRFFQVSDFHLESGEIIHDCRIGYRTFGKLNKDKSNVVLVPTWGFGTTEDFINYNFIAPGSFVDNSKYFVIAVDAFGNGVSSSPSNSKSQPGREFPVFTIRDMVNAQYKLLTQELKIDHILAVVGLSLGGMQAFQWMVSYPDFMDKVVPIVGTPSMTSYDLIGCQSCLLATKTALNCEKNQNLAYQLIATLDTLFMRTPDYYVTHTIPEEFHQAIADSYERIKKLDINDIEWQLKAQMKHDIFKQFGGSKEKVINRIKAKALVILSQQDHALHPSPAIELAKLLKAKILILKGNGGHLAVFYETDKVIPVLTSFLEE